MSGITVKTGERWERQVQHGRVAGVVRIPTVEVWIGGVRFVTDCTSDEAARALAVRIGQEIVQL